MKSKAQAVEIIPGRLFWVSDTKPPRSQKKAFFFCIDDDLVYKPFCNDFGPVNIAQTHRYCLELDSILREKKYFNCKIFHHCSTDYKKQANAAYLICAFQIIMLKRTSTQAWKYFEEREPAFIDFRDAMKGYCSYKCTILHCLEGLEYGIKLNLYSITTFNLDEYEYYEKLENGDLNWLIPGRFLAFSSPIDIECDYMINTRQYVNIFKKMGIKLVIRLNQKEYDRNIFIKNGIKHEDLYFLDGSTPHRDILNRFMQLCENEPGPIAVHCKAGLGRTGTLIGCYCIKHYKFTASSFISWNRLCRPGSVLGPQQHYLLEMEEEFKREELRSKVSSPVQRNHIQRLKLSPKADTDRILNNFRELSVRGKKCANEMCQEEKEIAEYGEKGQALRLSAAKKRHLLPRQDKKVKQYLHN